MFTSVLSIFREAAKNSPDALCVVDADGEHTYGQMMRDAEGAAAFLRAKGADLERCVIASYDGKAHYLSLEIACWLIGAIFVPVEDDAADERILSIYQETDPVLFVSDRKPASEDLNRITASYVELSEGEPERDAVYYVPTGEETAEILFTTGTTGKSKGVELTHANDVALAQNVAEGVHMRDGNRELIPLPLSHAHAIRTLYAIYSKHGAALLVRGVTQVRRIYELMRDYHATAIDLSPTAASVLLKLSRGRFSEFAGQLDYVQVGTAYLNDEIKENLRATFPGTRLYNCYGSTESGRSCFLDFSGNEDRKHCIGKPAVNAQFFVTNANHEIIHSDEKHTGLIATRGAMNMKGYWKQKELTESVMKDGYIFSKDEGYIDDKGYVYVLGRADDVINFRGIKIAPDEIEEVAADYPGILDCACIAKPDKVSGEVPILVVDTDEETFDHKAMMQYLRRRVDPDKIPQKIVICHQIPRSYNGKLQRKKLASELLEGDKVI